MSDFPNERNERRNSIPGIPQGHLPPHNLEAERSVLGAVLVQNEAIDRVREVGMEARDFYKDSHQKIFEAALALADRREPVDLVTLTSSLRDRGWFDQIGGTGALTSLFEDAFAVGNVAHYARIVRDKAVQRRMIEACSEIVGTALDGVEDTEAFLDEAENKVFKVADLHLENTITELKKVLLDNMATIEDLALRNEDITGLPTGFHDFDALTTGLHPGQIIIIAARPGMGKTSWFISALQHAAMKNGAVAALFSLEMSKEEIGFRFLSGLSKIDSRKLKTGKLQERDWRSLAAAADTLSKSRIYIDDSGGITVMDIRARCRRLKAKEKKLDLVVIDYLQLMKGSKASQRGDSSREREISEISRNLKELAKELQVPIIALSQLNRSVESRQDKRPGLSDLRESGAIEQDADMVCFIHREDYYDKQSENQGIAEFIVAKNRAGETSTVKLAWLAQYTLFENLAREAPGQPIIRHRPDKGDITL
ncbi:MAG: replicative DNA helicase [Bacteriovoracia bacterium]